MSVREQKAYTEGTHRARTPEDTLYMIAACGRDAGITRCADIAELDSIGVPVYSATRPTARVLQVSNGKGITPIAARVSALMEGIEHAMAERMPSAAPSVSLRSLARRGDRVVHPAALQGFRADSFFSDEWRLPWV